MPSPAKVGEIYVSSQTDRRSQTELEEEYGSFRSRLDSEPENGDLRVRLGDVCVKLGRREEGKGEYLKAAECRPELRGIVLKRLEAICDRNELKTIRVPKVRHPWYSDILGLFQYPFRGNGLPLLVGGGIVFAGLSFLTYITSFWFWVPLLILWGYMSACMIQVIQDSAQGGESPPDYPDFQDWSESILSPLGVTLAAAVIPAALPIGFLLLFGWHWVVLVLAAAGLFYAPMALVAGAVIRDAFACFNVPLVVRAMLQAPVDYFSGVILLFALILGEWLVSLGLGMVQFPGLIQRVLSHTVALYFLMVEMRLLGLIYYYNDRRFGWFRT